MSTYAITIMLSVVISLIAIGLQLKYFFETKKYISLFANFFKKREYYSTYKKTIGDEQIPQLTKVGFPDSDLNNLIQEINHYIVKTKGTTDFSVIQNKVERKLNMRYDQSTARLSFPTYIGLMGTFTGVFMGILMFICGFDGAGSISDDSIKNLLTGVLVSMATSLVGLFLTTLNNGFSGGSRKKVEEDKNEFFDFVQTELMPSIDVSMVAAITKLHETVDKFEPAFNRVINNFQQTFDRCTRAFGDDFEAHVGVVSNAVQVMGCNMDRINKNIELQGALLSTLKSEEFMLGLKRYIDAASRFNLVVRALDQFEETRKIMLETAQETIALQSRYNDALQVPRDIAIRVNAILNRITVFEDSINNLAPALSKREMLGNGVIDAIEKQVLGITKKSKIADRYLEMADETLVDILSKQTKVLNEMTDRYKQAIEGHIEGFESMIKTQTEQLESHHDDFVLALKEKFNIEEVREEFTNLKQLEAIEKHLSEMIAKAVKANDVESIQNELKSVGDQLKELKTELESINKNTKVKDKDKERSNNGGFFNFGRR